MGRLMLRVVAIGVATAVLVGCETIRVRGQDVSDGMENAPDWVVRNAMPGPMEDMVYFVGVSNEQVPSEAEAIDQAYEDAIRRAADSIGMSIVSRDVDVNISGAKTDAVWPYITGKHGGTFGNTLLPTIEKSEYSRSSKIKHGSIDADIVLRDQIVGMARIVDTWTVRENFRMSVSLNAMKYGELWKAKVLVGIPSRELEKRADFEFEIRQREVDLLFEPQPKPTFTFMGNGTGYRGANGGANGGSHFTSYAPGPRPLIIERD